MRVKNWIKTVPTLVIIGTVVFMVLTVVGEIALWVGYAALIGAAAVLLALIAGFLAHERQIKHAATNGRARTTSTRESIAVG